MIHIIIETRVAFLPSILPSNSLPSLLPSCEGMLKPFYSLSVAPLLCPCWNLILCLQLSQGSWKAREAEPDGSSRAKRDRERRRKEAPPSLVFQAFARRRARVLCVSGSTTCQPARGVLPACQRAETNNQRNKETNKQTNKQRRKKAKKGSRSESIADWESEWASEWITEKISFVCQESSACQMEQDWSCKFQASKPRLLTLPWACALSLLTWSSFIRFEKSEYRGKRSHLEDHANTKEWRKARLGLDFIPASELQSKALCTYLGSAANRQTDW